MNSPKQQILAGVGSRAGRAYLRGSSFLGFASVALLAGLSLGAIPVALADTPASATPSASTTAPAAPGAAAPGLAPKPALGAKPADPAESEQVKQMLQDAQRAINDGKMDLAVIELKNAIRLAPGNAEVRGDLGMVLQRTGDTAQAERELRQALQDGGPKKRLVPSLMAAMLTLREFKSVLTEFPDPKDTDDNAVEILRARSAAYQALGNFDEAKASIDRALKIRRDAPGLLARARIALQQKDMGMAESLSDEATALDPKDVTGDVFKVEIKRQSGDREGALVLADGVLKKDPNNLVTKVTKISLLIDLKRDDEAKKEIEALLVTSPNLPAPTYFKAVLLAKSKDFIGAWRLAQTLPPEFIQADPSIGVTVASMAADSGQLESANTILTALIAGHPAVDSPATVNARTLSAFVHLRQNQPQDAMNALEPLKGSKDTLVVGLLAQASMGLRHFDEAVKYLQSADASSGDNATLQQELAVSELASGKINEGLDQLQALFNKDPTQPVYAGLLIGFLSRSGRWDEAYATIEKMAAKDPKSALPSYYRGQLLAQQGKFADAATAFGQSLALDAKFLPARYGRALVLVNEGELSAARNDIDEILKQDPKNLAALIKKADIAAREGKPPEAIAVLNQAIAELPKDPKPRLALANYLMEQGKTDEALSTVKSMTEQFPDNFDALNLLGTIQMVKGQKDDSVATFRSLVDRVPSSVTAKLRLASALAENNDKGGAAALVQKIVLSEPKNINARRVLISLRISGKQFDSAIDAAKDYIPNQTGTDGDVLLADTYMASSRPNDAIASLTAALPHADSNLIVRLAQILTTTGSRDKALDVVNTWVKAHPADTDAKRYYAGILMESGNAAEARIQYEAVLKDRPDDSISLNNLGWMIQKEDPARAVTLVGRAYKVSPNSPDIVDTLGWIKFQSGDKKDALTYLDKAHSMVKDDPTVSYHYAVALDATGDKAKAKQMVQEALSSKKTFSDADAAKTLAATLH